MIIFLFSLLALLLMVLLVKYVRRCRKLRQQYRQAAAEITRLEQALAETRDHERSQSLFFASVHHEIRAPLNALLGFAELLQDETLSSAEAGEYLEGIICSGQALLQLVNDVLDLAKLSYSEIPIVAEPCNFSALAATTTNIFQGQLRHGGVTMCCKIAPMPPLQLPVQQIRQILINLLSNAVKFTTRGTITLQAEYSHDRANPGRGTLTFAVTDTGMGIAAADQGKVMEPFFQQSQHTERVAGNCGTGLGLTICKRIIDALQGTIQLASTPDKGSTFTVTLYNIAPAPEVEMPAPKPPPQISRDYAGCALLIVDDTPMNLKMMAALCRKCGCLNISLASSGKAALETLQRQPIDMVLTDIRMPGMDGVELARRIRAESSLKAVKIVAITADDEARTRFPDNTFDDVLLKPVNRDKINALTRWLN